MANVIPHRKPSGVSVLDQFCGAGGSSIGATAAGAQVVVALNHWQRAIETHNSNFPDTYHECTDISAVDPRRYPSTDVLITSPECFPAETLILTDLGQLPIDQIRVGDLVYTHRGRWRRVTAVMQSVKDTIIIRGHGHYGLECTKEHPFYTCGRKTRYVRDEEYGHFEYLQPNWTPAWQSVGRFWATPMSYAEEMPSSMFDDAELPEQFNGHNPAFWWMIGRWLGDGSVFNRPKKGGEITICCGNHEADNLEPRLKEAGGLTWYRRQVRTATLFDARHTVFANWLSGNFGKKAGGKRLPSWLYHLPERYRRALLEGYVSADGSKRRENGYQAMTISRELAIGIRLLATSLGYEVALHKYDQHNHVIEGRTVNTQPFYHLAWSFERKRNQGHVDGHHVWLPVKEAAPGRKNVTVYNLSVEEDESYVADGIVVHNCTNHTLAKGVSKKRQQVDLWGVGPTPESVRSRSTMWDVCRFAEFHHYNIIIVENVVDARQWIFWDSWIHAMTQGLDYDYQEVYFNSMFAHPVPQSRDRLYTVFWKRGNKKPNLDFTPLAFCPKCAANVSAVQCWKNPAKKWGKYKFQYTYNCPKCATVVEPYYYCAANAIDWSYPIERIADRKHPLKPKTMARIEQGLQKFLYEPFLAGVNSSRMESSQRGLVSDAFPTQVTSHVESMVVPPAWIFAPGSNGQFKNIGTDPFPTQVTQASPMLTVAPMLVDSGGVWESPARDVTEPYPTQTIRRQPGLLMPFVMDIGGAWRNEPRAVTEAYKTQTTTRNAGLVVPFTIQTGHGGHESAARVRDITRPLETQHSLATSGIVAAPFTVGLSYEGNGYVHDITEPISTQTARQDQGVVVAPYLMQYNGNSQGLHEVTEAIGTQTSHDRHSLICAPVELPTPEECYFRTIRPPEVQRAMGFPDTYIITGTQREQVHQLGNAVTAPVMTMITERCFETLKGA